MLCQPPNSEISSESKSALKIIGEPVAPPVEEQNPKQVIALENPTTLKLVICNAYKINLQSDKKRFVSLNTQPSHSELFDETVPMQKQTISILNNRDLSSSKQAAGPASGSSGSQHHLKINEPLAKI